jgi:hypothetical protein
MTTSIVQARGRLATAEATVRSLVADHRRSAISHAAFQVALSELFVARDALAGAASMAERRPNPSTHKGVPGDSHPTERVQILEPRFSGLAGQRGVKW